MTLETGNVYFSEQGKAAIPEQVSLFGFSISFYGLCLMFAALIGILLAVREGRKRKQDTEWTLTLLWLTIVSALLGARVYYALFQWYPFSKAPLSVLNFRSGGLAYFGALFGAWFTVRWYCRRKKEDFETAADVLCVGAAAAAVLVWVGCALTREPIGRFYDGLFSVRIGAEYLPQEAESARIAELLERAYRINGKLYVSMHPVALYGIFASILILIGIWIARHFIKRSGNLFRLYLFLNAASCLVLEQFRASRCCVWGTELPINSLVAAALLLVITAGAIRNRVKQKIK
ncbi:MAG: prolipoprotein diacylglyceryl transferase [Lachnospiraceae bacterium]